jgi:peptide/nickel transport system substrate-binding protein
MGNTRTFSDRVERSSAGSTPGSEELEEIVNAGLTVVDGSGSLRPLLAESVPTIENGQWRVFPDGRMETTWQIRANAQWHDGTPFTADDLVFTMAVVKDPDLRAFHDVAYNSVEKVEASDARTVTVAWSRPFIEADTLFSRVRGQPLPKHLLERAFTEDKAGFLELPYWNRDFVGLGAFKVKEWVGGSYTIFAANEQYVLGRPKLDELEVRFIADQNTLVANILAGAIDVTLGRSISLDQASQIRDAWRDGKMELGPLDSWIAIYPQFINPNPAVIGNLTFRQALYHAIDRQAMADTLMLGMVPIAESIISPLESQHGPLDSAIVRYPYDLRRASQLVESLGYSKGPDGTYRDSAGVTLTVPTQTSQGNALQEKSLYAVGDFIERLGIPVEPDVVPPQARSDLARRAGRPGLEIQKQPSGADALPRYHSRTTPLPENNYAGNNRSRYRNADFDGLMDRYFTTIPRAERNQLMSQIVRHMTENLNAMGLIFDVDPLMISNRADHVAAIKDGLSTVAWNAHEWSVK